jgi:hypothetical protein
MTNPVNPFASNGAAPNPGGGTFVMPNLDHIQDTSFYAPPGEHPATLTGFCQRMSQSNSQGLDFEFKVHTQNGDVKKNLWCPLSANAQWKLKKIAIALKIPPGAIEAKMLIGRKCTAIIVPDGDYNGKPDSRIDIITLPSNVAGLTTTGDDQVPF